MSTSRILLMLLMLINYVAGDLLQMTTAPINITRVIRNITGKTITACYLECGRENGCDSISITDGAPNQLPTCHLLKKDNGHFEGGDSMTVVQTIGLGPTVNGQWGCYTDVSKCNASCGGGYLNQSRECDSPKPEHGGANCSGLAHRTISCNTHSCPVIDGNWGAWINDSECTVVCGAGNLMQKRLCDSPKPEHGGKDCNGDGERTISCNTHSCPVHGSWGAWKVTSFCNDDCIGGTFTKERQCDSPAPEHGGKECNGYNVTSRPCSTNACPVVNIALKKQATQSGRLNPRTEAYYANDGDKYTFSTTSYKAAPWWQVDLQVDVEIEYFVLRGNKAELKILGKSATDTLYQICKDPVNLKTDFEGFSCDSNRRFRFIRIEQKRMGYLYINEFEAYVEKKG